VYLECVHWQASVNPTFLAYCGSFAIASTCTNPGMEEKKFSYLLSYCEVGLTGALLSANS
jgi:hypothetical protein